VENAGAGKKIPRDRVSACRATSPGARESATWEFTKLNPRFDPATSRKKMASRPREKNFTPLDPEPYTLHLKSYTLSVKPYVLTDHTLYRDPYPLNPTPYTLHPAP